MITLCKFCNAANGNFFSEGNCFICENKMNKFESLAERAADELKNYSTFSISTVVPKNWLIREELIWDFAIERSESIKTRANRVGNRIIAQRTGAKPCVDGDARITFDVEKEEFSIEPNELFIFGRYCKLVRGISQSRWVCAECGGKGCKRCDGKGKMYESVEEKIGEVMKKECDASEYALHASGREDIDVINTAGRPFVMELKRARNRRPDLNRIAEVINEKKEVFVSDLKIVKRGVVELVASSHFDKEYEVDVEFEKTLNEEEIKKILSLRGTTIEQLTPQRVAHRRAKIDRRRKILDVKFLSKKENKATFLIRTEAGTYIKELITGDGGRTRPSFSSILKMKVNCIGLKVAKIDDEFLKESLG